MWFRSPTALAVVIGAALGALFALARPRAEEQGSASTPQSVTSAAFRPVGQLAAERRRARAVGSATKSTAPRAPEPEKTVESPRDASAAADESARRRQEKPSKAPVSAKPRVPDWPAPASGPKLPEALVSPHERPIETPEELQKSEIRCDQRQPDECIRAADAYDLGRIVAKNDDRADRHRKVGLTHYVNQCHSQDPSACFALARMYREGDIVKEDAAQAEALIEHVSRLCVYKKDAVCEALDGRAR